MPPVIVSSPEVIAPIPAPQDNRPNEAGVFERYESVRIEGMPVKCAGEIYLAPAVHAARSAADWSGPGFYIGYYLVMRQPANTAKQLPSIGMPCFATREAAIAWVADEIAAKFFSDHKIASERLAVWRAKVLSAEKPVAVPRVSDPVVQPVVEAATLPPARVVSKEMGAIKTRYEFIPLAAIEPNPKNQRKAISEEAIKELATSIAALGYLMHAIVLRDLGEGSEPRYRLIAGERRWRAHCHLGWGTIEAKIFSGCSDELAAEMALIENLQREQLNPMEEAEGFAELQKDFGYSLERIAERTGKAEGTIKAAVRLVPLAAAAPEAGQWLRTGELTVRCARRLAVERWISRPAHCTALAKWAVTAPGAKADFEENLSVVLTRGAAAALAEANLAVNISAYREHIDPASYTNDREEHHKSVLGRRGSDIMPGTDGSLWHLAPDIWKVEKKAIDQAIEAERADEEARAAKKVSAAAEGGVNVRVEDLTKAGAEFKAVAAEELRYVPHLAPGLFANGIDEQEREVVICLKPREFVEALAKLQEAEAALIAADRRAKLPLLHDDATAAIKRLKRIGSREIAFLLTASATVFADGEAWERQGVTPPAQDLTCEQLATIEPIELVRVALESKLINSTGGELFGALRWILNVATLGLAEEYEQSREEILAKAAAVAFPVVTTDPKRLAEWQKARALGMPVQEIARSYRAAIEDVCGALGVPVPQD